MPPPEPPPDTPRRRERRPALLIANPVSRLGRRPRLVARVVEILRRGGFDIEVRVTEGPRHATELAREGAADGARAVFAFGGDGTLRETAAGLLGTPVPVGFLPGGTASVMTLALGLPRRPLPAAELLCRAGTRELDVGLCGRRPFLMQASAGLDAFVLGHVGPLAKRRFGRTAVGAAAAVALPRYRYPPVELEVDGRRLSASFAAVCNIPFYGGGWRLIPQARPDDRQLELLVFGGRGARATLGFAADLFLRRRHLKRADVRVVPVRDRVELLASTAAPLQIDGDPLPETPPVAIVLSPHRLQVLAP